MTQSKKDQAIEIIEECRLIHMQWTEFQETDPNWKNAILPEDVGMPVYHWDWIKKYDLVLEVLRSL